MRHFSVLSQRWFKRGYSKKKLRHYVTQVYKDTKDFFIRLFFYEIRSVSELHWMSVTQVKICITPAISDDNSNFWEISWPFSFADGIIMMYI